MKLFSFRLEPGQDLKAEIEKYARANGIKAGFIVTCVGGLEKVTMRMAGATPDKQDIRTIEKHLEIVSLVGTLAENGSHIHIAVSDKEGEVMGGHLKDGAIVNPTAEIVLGEDPDKTFIRKMDNTTGFNELTVE